MVTWDDYWKNYSPSKAEKFLISERDKVLNKYLDKLPAGAKNVLEVGCGFGSNIRLIKGKREDVNCFALDYSPEAINAVRNEIPDAIVADCRSMGFSDKSFDLVYSAGLIEHFVDETPVLSEMRRILKDDGYIVTFVPARYSLWEFYQLLHFGFWQHGYEKSYTYNGLKELFLLNRFRVVEIGGIDPFSIQGMLMKVFNISFEPLIKKSPQKSGYTELFIVTKKNF
ncbi:MAG: hypothetical protein B5M53_02380 [Candidatus Cloacimonas sp. 4484_209]|nr:MAG: hypothetical protein B5M53_02380 [Candidatus Cloacimonas sp. 4484_209]